MIDKITIQSSFFNALELLSNEQLGRLVKCLFNYQRGIDVTTDADIAIVYALLRDQMDADKQRNEKRRAAGSLGGRKRVENAVKQSQASSSKVKQSQAKSSNDINICQSSDYVDNIEKTEKLAANKEEKETEREEERKFPPAPPIKKEKDKEKEKEESQNILCACENFDSSSLSAKPTKFNFKKAMLSLNIPENILDDWLKVRLKKRASNTETAFKGIVREINASGISATECVRMAAENSWTGIKAQWVQETIKRMGGKLPEKVEKENIFTTSEPPKPRTIYDTIREQQERDEARAKAIAGGHIPPR